MPVGARGPQQLAQLGGSARASACAIGERRGIRIQGAHLLARKGRQHRATGRGEVRGQPHADVGDQGRTPRGALVDDVDDVGPAHDGKVRALSRAVGERGDEGPAETRERCLPGVAAGELERGDAEAPAALVRHVHDEPVLFERRQQVVHRGARDGERRRQGAGGDGAALAREEGEDAQRLVGGGHLGAQESVCHDRHRMPRAAATCDARVWNQTMSMQLPASVVVGGSPLTAADVVAVARHGARIELDADAMTRVAASRALIEGLADDPEPHYGVSTGFGALATTFIAPERRRQLQLSLIRSHAAGTGAEVEPEVVRALQLLRLQTLASGRTGVRPVVVATYAAMLDAGITPIVREYGSLGCSGDLAPLSHVALAAMGEGEVRVLGPDREPSEPMSAAEALAEASLLPLVLEEKEGLALINGTDGMLGMLLLALHDFTTLLDTADLAAAMSVESQLGTDAVFAADLMALRPQLGQAASAANLRAYLADSPIVASHKDPALCTRVQDAYSLRCSPQVHGAARDTADHAALVASRELASTVDNPVITLDGRVESNGNFHGAPVGYVLDFLAIAVADVASISERRTDRALDPARSNGLPPFLADEVGVDSGLMIAQYAAAGIVSELKRLAVPASVDSIPSSAMQEDHVSMGWAAARKLRRGIDGLSRVLAIELMTGVRALDLRAPLQPGAATGSVRDLIRAAGVKGPGPDRFLSPDIEAVTGLVISGEVARVAESAIA